MDVRRCFSLVMLAVFLIAVTTQDLQAAGSTGASPSGGSTVASLHGTAQAELHQAVQASQERTREARKAVQDFLARPDVRSQIQRAGLAPEDLAAQAALLSEAELLYVQQQIMSDDLQRGTAGGMTSGGKIMTGIGLALIGAGVVMMVVGDEDDETINWTATGAIWAGAGAVLTIIGLTRRE